MLWQDLEPIVGQDEAVIPDDRAAGVFTDWADRQTPNFKAKALDQKDLGHLTGLTIPEMGQ